VGLGNARTKVRAYLRGKNNSEARTTQRQEQLRGKNKSTIDSSDTAVAPIDADASGLRPSIRYSDSLGDFWPSFDGFAKKSSELDKVFINEGYDPGFGPVFQSLSGPSFTEL
jgi:hypothetical protein